MLNQPDPHQRYAGKPLLKLLDAYVLWSIGELPSTQESSLQQMTEKLQQTWNRTEEHWHALLASQMEFPPTMPATIREMWHKNQAIAASNRETLTPLGFTYLFVDQNFAGAA